MGPDEPAEGEQPGERRGRVERVVFALVREPLFLPVTFVIAAHLALAVATAWVYVLRDGAYGPVVLLLGALLGSVKLVHLEVRDAGRPGPVLAWVVFTWLAAAGTTWGLFEWL